MKSLGLLAASTLLAVSITAQADEAANSQAAGMETMMLQMAKQQALKTCANEELLSCLDVSKADCEGMMNGVIDQCMAPNMSKFMNAQNMTPEEEEALNKEVEECAEGISKKYGVDPEKAKSCPSN